MMNKMAAAIKEQLIAVVVIWALCILQPVPAQDPTTSTTHSSTSASSESTTTAATTTNYATDSGGDGGLGNLADMSTTTTEEPDTTLIATTPVLQTRLPVDFNFTTPEFMGWPELGTEPKTTTESIIPPTRRPAGTIACPLCWKETNAGATFVTCRSKSVWCDQYAGCWYYKGTDGLQIKGCMNIIPREAEMSPTECTDFYKDGFCVKGQCLSCDLFGVGGGSVGSLTTASPLLLLLLATINHIYCYFC